jgi:hypothetical protein
LPALNKLSLSLELLLLLLRDDIVDLLAFLTIVLVLEHQHVCLLHVEVESVLQFLSLLSCLLLKSSEFSLTFLYNSIDIHKSIITKHLLLLLQNLSSTMDQYLFILLFCKCLLRCNFSRLNNDLVKFESDGLPLEYLLLDS